MERKRSVGTDVEEASGSFELILVDRRFKEEVIIE